MHRPLPSPSLSQKIAWVAGAGVAWLFLSVALSMVACEVYRRVGHNRPSVLSIPVQTREVGTLKNRLTFVAVLVTLLMAVVPLMGGCAVSTHVVNATVYGAGSNNQSEAAKAADQAVADLTKSQDAPVTLEPGKLTIASDPAYPPLEYSARVITIEAGEDEESKSDPQTVGFEIDLCKAIAKKLGLEPVFVTVAYDDIQSELSEGTADMAASGLITSPGLLTQLSPSDTYLAADLAICTRVGVDLPDAESLQGKIVGTQQGSTAEPAVDGFPGVAENRPYPHVLGAFDDLRDDKVDAVVVVQPVAAWILATDSGYANALQISGVIETGEGYAIWTTKGNEGLIAAVNAALQELMQTPEPEVETTTTVDETTSAPDASTTTTLGETTTTESTTETTKSVYQLLLEKWGLTVE